MCLFSFRKPFCDFLDTCISYDTATVLGSTVKHSETWYSVIMYVNIATLGGHIVVPALHVNVSAYQFFGPVGPHKFISTPIGHNC